MLGVPVEGGLEWCVGRGMAFNGLADLPISGLLFDLFLACMLS